MKFGKYILLLGFISVIVSFGIFSFLSEDLKTSQLENRTLAQNPVKDPSLIWSGEYFKQFETYFTDQFIARDKWVEQYTKLQMKISPTYVNGYYVTSDDTILEKPINYTDTKQLDLAASQLNRLGEHLTNKKTKLYFVSNPSKSNMLARSLPDHFPKGKAEDNKEYFLSQLDKKYVNTLDIGDIFNEKYDYKTITGFYFKTDHHWNMKGAFIGYQLMMEEISKDFQGIPQDFKKSDYKYSCITGLNNFLGSWNKSLSMQVKTDGESYCYYEPKNYSFDDFVTHIDGKKVKSDYFYAQIKGTNKPDSHTYASLYTNDLKEYKVVNPDSPNSLKVLVIKDSYMNPIPLHLAHHFQETTFYDMRHNFDRTVYDYLEKNKFDIVLVAYNDVNYYDNLFNFNKPATK